MSAPYRFGRFELDPGRRQLLVGGKPVALGARAFDVLVALVERSDRMVTKDELLEFAWPGLVVEENNLQVQISALRKALGAQAITTIPGRGYRFTSDVLQQRLVAIMAADVAGYSRLMAANERATVEALDEARKVFRTLIESADGRVIDMAGDSVLAVFPTATGAVSAALAIQQELHASGANVPEDRRMRFRVGVHLGDVIEKEDRTIYGDGVNIAARLQGLAEPGGILVSDAVWGAVRGKVMAEFADQGEQTVKNIAHPIRAFAVTVQGTGTKPSRAAGDIDLSLPGKPSIAVLPSANLSDDPEQEYFADGVVDDIITALSRVRAFFVIARNSRTRSGSTRPCRNGDAPECERPALSGACSMPEPSRSYRGGPPRNHEFLRIAPSATLKNLRAQVPLKRDADFERYGNALRKAGMPE